MRFAFYTNTVSPHQLPLARALARLLGAENYRYIHTDALTDERMRLGWGVCDEPWIIPYGSEDAGRWLRDADIVMMQHPRDWALFEDRLSRGLRCIYASERWFKPPLGIMRLLHPAYLRMARRFVRLASSPNFICLPDGIHAARDMVRLCGLMHGDLRCLFRATRLDFERKAGGRLAFGSQQFAVSAKRCCLDRMRLWGYFVDEGEGKREEGRDKAQLRVLWVGRLLKWKRVDTIICAVGEVVARSARCARLNITLDIYGTGPEEARLKKMAAKYGDCIKFHPPVPISEVRELMRRHDVYVLASDAHEGWGAVVSEALEEGMKIVGTFEAGASATILPPECLFHAGDWRRLAELLVDAMSLPDADRTAWTAKDAAQILLGL